MSRAPASQSPAAARFARLPRACARIATLLVVAAAMVTASAAGCGNAGIVGGDCAAGYTQCNLSCLDLQTDPANCGACGNACPPGVSCAGGVCGGTALGDGAPWNDADYIPDGEVCDVSDPAHPVCHPRPHLDASHGDGAGDDGSSDGSVDGTLGDGGGGDGSPGEGGGGDGAGNDGSGGDACAPPYDTPQSCGACGNACVAPNPVCELVDGGYQCAPTCDPPLTDCSGQCVNLARDPANCGTCGKVCASQYCFQSICQGSVAGSVIVIGHDFQKTAPGDVQAHLLANSVFYNTGPVNLVSFEHYADAATVANGLAILKNHAAMPPAVAFNVQATSDDTSLTNDTLLAGATAVIIWDQPNAPAGTLGSLGTTWGSHLTTFAQGGGLVIALDAAQGVAEMPALITNAGLLAVTGHGAVPSGSPADVPLAGVSIARGMTTVYLVEQNTAWFTTSEAGPKTLYVANVQGQPLQLLAVQKVVN